MASSAVSSVMGKPFITGSCFGFLSFAGAAGMAALAGTSSPRNNTQAMDKNVERNALGRSEIDGIRVWLECCGSSSFVWPGFIPAPYKINPRRGGKLQSASRCVEYGAVRNFQQMALNR